MLSNNLPFEVVFLIFSFALLSSLLVVIWQLLGGLKVIGRWRRLRGRIKRKISPLLHKVTPKFILRLARFIYFKLWIIWLVIAIPFAAFLFHDIFVKVPGVNFHIPGEETSIIWQDQRKPFEIQFDRPVDVNSLVPEITVENYDHEVNGRWEYEDKGLAPFKRKLLFYPDETILPDKNIVIYLALIRGLFQSEEPWDKQIDLVSAVEPKVKASTPSKDSADMGIDQSVVIELDANDGEFINWQAEISPQIELNIVREIDKIKIEFPNKLAQAKEYTINLYSSTQIFNFSKNEASSVQDKKLIYTLPFKTVKGANLKSASMQGSQARVGEPLKLEFDYEVFPEEIGKVIKFEPVGNYSLSWENNNMLLAINPEGGFKKETDYKVTIPKGIRNSKGGVSEEDIVHTFRTIGEVKIVGNSPGNNNTSRSLSSNISVTFDQEVDKSSAQGKFSLNPKVDGKFSWSGNTMTFDPASLSYGTKYTASVGSGVKAVHGIDSRKSFSFSFTTAPRVFTLNVPSIRQPYSYACNLTAAKMVLQYRGINVSVEQIHAAIGTSSPQGYDSGSNNWGNPNAGFVGSLNGSGSAGPNGSGGYGVHWNPIRNYIAGRGRGATVKTYGNVSDMLKDVQAGNPVIIWGHNGRAGSGRAISWNSSGGTVRGLKGMHSYVVVGFIGEAENPSSVIVNDPGGAGRVTRSIGWLNGVWGGLGRVGVVVN